MARGASQMK